MNGIAFRVDETLKMRHIREAEGSNSAAIDLMAKYAIDAETRAAMPPERFIEIVDEMTMLEFYTLYAEFIGSSIPKQSGRRS